MLEMIDIGIDHAIAFRAGEKITESEMNLVLADAKSKIKRYGSIVVYEEIESFKGIELSAIVAELKYLFDVGLSGISKVAVVSNKKWINKIVKIEDKIFRNIEMRYFPIEKKEMAIDFLKNT